jgi:HK97 family phage portal protein
MQQAITEMRAAREYAGKDVTQLSRNGWGTIAPGLNIQPSEVFSNGFNASSLAQIYSKSALVNACIKEKSTSISEARMMVGREIDGVFEEIPDHEALSLWYDNEHYDYSELIETIVARLDLTGVSYFALDNYVNRVGIGGMTPIPTHLVREFSSGPRVLKYEVTTDGNPVVFTPEEMMAIGYLDPVGYRKYTSPMGAAIKEYQIDVERQVLTQETMINRQMPGLIMTPDHNLNPKQAQQLKDSIAQATGGDNHSRGKALVTPFGIKIESGFDLKDIDFESLNNLTETRVCMVFGVSPIIIAAISGLVASTYANYEQASIATYRETYVPLWKKVEVASSRKILKEQGLVYKFDLSEIAELQEDATDRANRAKVLFSDAKLITKNEGREMIGQDPVDGGDEFGKDPVPQVSFGAAPMDKEEQEKPETEGKEASAFGRPPEEALLERTLIREFGKQEQEALAMLKKTGSVDLLNIGSTLGQAIEDTLMLIAQDSASKTLRKFVGKSSSKFEGKATAVEIETAFNVVNPELAKVIGNQAMILSEATLAKTVKDLDKTLATIREELLAAQVTGPNTVAALTEGVQKVFGEAKDFRARRIAVTESSRAVHSAEIISGEASGVVQGWALEPSADACELCQQYNEDNKPTGKSLYPYTDNKSALDQMDSYDNRSLAPIHPNCRCTNIPVFVDEVAPAESGTKLEQFGKKPGE